MHIRQSWKTLALLALISGLPLGMPPSRAFVSAPRTSCASARRRFVVGAVARPEQSDRAALGKQLERRVAQPLDDDDLERGPGRPRPSSGGARRNERDAGENENGEQGKDADRPDHPPDSQRTT
jgi:hypothetical protein